MENNVDAIKFYEAHGFAANGKRQLEEGSSEYKEADKKPPEGKSLRRK